jgi:hypothetical protein
LGVKEPGREADHSIHLVPRSRMCGAIPPIPQYAFMAWFSKHRDTFNFYLLRLTAPIEYAKPIELQETWTYTVGGFPVPVECIVLNYAVTFSCAGLRQVLSSVV